MRNTNSPLSPETWLNDLFTSKAVTQGGAIRRKRRDIERFAGLEPFLNEINRRGYCAIENAGQIVIFCNQGPIRWLTPNHPPRVAPLSFKESGSKTFQDFGITPR